MKIISLAAAATAFALIAAPAFAQTYDQSAPSVIGGGAVGTVSAVGNGVVDGVGTVVGGVGTVVGDAVAVPGNVLLGRSAFVGQPTPCTVTGGGAVGTCNSTSVR